MKKYKQKVNSWEALLACVLLCLLPGSVTEEVLPESFHQQNYSYIHFASTHKQNKKYTTCNS